VKRLLESKRARQVVSLYGSQLFYLVGGTVTSILNTRYLDPTSYGRYSFALSLTGFVLLFIDF
jgi:O-antigen/teichoic acid export membrane protein